MGTKLQLRIPDLVKNKYLVSHPESLNALETEISNNKGIARAVAGSMAESDGGNDQVVNSGNQSPSHNRTLATPDDDGCTVPSFDNRVDLVSKPLDEFTAGDAATTKDQIPWLIRSDLDIVVLVSNDGNGFVQKKIMTIADVLCHITKDSMVKAAKQKSAGVPSAEETCKAKDEAEAENEEECPDTGEGEEEEDALECDQEVEAHGERYENL
eukprot:s1724_g18.t1